MELSSLTNVAVLSSIISAMVALFLRGFVEQWGRNAADKFGRRIVSHEDARGRQPVDQENAVHADGLAASTQLRLAAMDKRLRAHQEAFTLSRRIFRAYFGLHVGNESIEARERTARECRDWWEQNCLYLEPTVREVFIEAVISIDALGSTTSDAAGLVSGAKAVSSLGGKIEAAVQLPTIAIDERTVGEAIKH